MKSPLISIVISVYNAGQSLVRMVDSICAQTIDDWELILVNDGSTDNNQTLSIIEGITNGDSRISAITIPNSGCMAARVKGILRARGKYLYICDQDDYLHPELFAYSTFSLAAHKADLLMFRHESCWGDQIPTVAKLDPYASYPIQVTNLSDASADIESFRSYIKLARFDVWELFMERRLIQQDVILQDFKDSSIFYKIICSAHTGLISDLRLYYYYRDVADSMSRRAISIGRLRHIHQQSIARYAVLSGLVQAKDRAYNWTHYGQLSVAASIKRLLKPLERTRKRISSHEFSLLCVEFFRMIIDLRRKGMFRIRLIPLSSQFRLWYLLAKGYVSARTGE